MDYTVEPNNVKEILTTNRFIVKRLTQVLEQTECLCPCHSTDADRELERVKEKIKSLEEDGIKKDKDLEALTNQLEKLKATIYEVVDDRSKLFKVSNVQEEFLPRKTTEVNGDQHSVSPVCHASSKNQYSETGVENEKECVITDFENKEDKSRLIETPDALTTDVEERKQPQTTLSTKESMRVPHDDRNVAGGRLFVSDSLASEKNPQGITLVKIKSYSDETKIANKAVSKVEDSGSTIYTHVIDESDFEAKPRSVAHANFKKKPLQDTLGVNVVEQTEKQTIHFRDWHYKANKEEHEGKLSGLSTLRGLFTIVCVDISYSMTQGNAWEQVRIFFKDFIDSLKLSMNVFNIDEESVSLVTFGHKTEVLKRLTNDFSSLEMAFDGISIGGPSPMYGGLLLCAAVAKSPMASGAKVNGITLLTKVVIITDGNPTDTNLVAGPDELTPSEQDDTQSQIIEVMQKMGNTFDVYCVAVGNANTEFLQLMSAVSNGRLLTYRDGKKVGSRLRKTVFASGGISRFRPTTESDEEDFKEILEAAERTSNLNKSYHYNEVDSGNLPQIGSRVRRGPDWRYEKQDANGPGTVVGYADNYQQVWVEWDYNAKINIYRYCASDGFDVLLTDEPRLPDANGRLRVGCVVKPGIDWQQTTRNVKVTDKGVVIKMKSRDRVKVRWQNKERGKYSYGVNGKKEVEFCPPEGADSSGSQSYVSNPYGAAGYSYTPNIHEPTPSQPKYAQPYRNKNKNVVNKNKNVNKQNVL